ncbi:MAG: sigma-70 family RNA polymerase sigma factor [Planctomycetota bacterium]
MSSPDSVVREAFARALEDWPRVYGFASTLVRDSASAEDLCQGAYTRLLERAATVDCSRSLLPLLLKIVRNLAVSEYRRRRPESLADPAAGLVDAQADDPSVVAERHERSATLHDALERLPGNWGAAVYLKDGLAFSYREIGEVLEASEDTVRTMLHRARLRLSTLLSERTAGP